MSDDEQISVYDEVEIEDMTYDETLQLYHYPCPCGDRFEIALHDLMDGEDIGVCPSCSLMIRVIFEVVSRCLSFCLGKAWGVCGVGAVRGGGWVGNGDGAGDLVFDGMWLTRCGQDNLPKPPGQTGEPVAVAA
jgi:diphthamide biosynthesis protein 3